MNALVLGGARGLFDDLAALEALHPSWADTVLAVNDAGWGYTGRIDHWVTLHHENLPRWRKERARRVPDDSPFTVWCDKPWPPGIDRIVHPWGAGSSGFLAVVVALEHLQAERVVLCGVPMDPIPHFFDRQQWTACDGHREAWKRNMDRLGRVRSLSGWTRAQLGAPDPEWLAGTSDAILRS